MKRAGIALVVLLFGQLAASAPAGAHTDFCVGTGVATLTVGFGTVGLHPVTTSAFTFNESLGVCFEKAELTATGTVTGNCGSSVGSGTTGNGHAFSFTAIGGQAVITGEVTGTATWAADLASGSCTAGTARRFIVAFEVALTH